MLVATAGHVDHGKTELVRALTGVDTDRLPEEKARGLTIDLGFAYRELPGGDMLGFVDVPGHERFVRNMLAGVAAIDFVLLVVAADDGPMPQTAEHLAIVDLLGLSRGAAVITKADAVDAARVAAVEAEVGALLAPTALGGAPAFAVSALTGAGMDALDAHLVEAAAALPPRPTDGNFRLAIDRNFTVQGAGLVVTGAVFSGEVEVGARLRLAPSGLPVRVRGIHAQGRESRHGRAGERCALNVSGAGLDRAEVHRGDWLVDPALEHSSARLDTELRLLATETRELRHWTPVHVHLGAGFYPGRVSILEDRSIAPGESGLARLVLERPAPAVWGDHFVLRDQSARRTIGGGRVIDPLPPGRRQRRAQRLATLAALREPEPRAALTALLDGPTGADLDHFTAARNLRADEAEALFESVDLVAARQRGVRIGVSRARWSALQASLATALGEWHEEHPDLVGPGEAELARRAGAQMPPAIVADAVHAAIAGGQILREGFALRLPGHQARLPAEDQKLMDRVAPHLSPRATKPPVVTALAQDLGLERPFLEAFLGRSARRGLLVRVAANRYFHPAAVASLAAVAESLAGDDGRTPFEAKTYRDASGIGRNLTIQVLEFFDAQGFTRRIGDRRVIARPGADVFGASPRAR